MSAVVPFRFFSFLLIAAVAMGQQRNFIACPIVRDTKTVPCFLAEYEGETYYLGIQQDITAEFHPPQLKHEVLVEGRVKPGPRVCGGIPLEPLSISVIKELNLACNTILPPEPGIEAPPAPRGAGPASKRLDARAAVSDGRTGRQEFTIHYRFDDDFLEYAGQATLNEAAAYAQRTGATGAKIAGYRATSILSNGTRLVERPGLAEKRAKRIETLLRGLGLSSVGTAWKDDPEPGDGQNDAARRRVTILVNP